MMSNGSYVLFDSNNAGAAARLVFASRFFLPTKLCDGKEEGGVCVRVWGGGDKVSGPKNARVILLGPAGQT